MNKKRILRKAAVATAIFLLGFLLAFSQALYRFDRLFSDPLYQSGSASNGRVKIIAIDERTLQRYGNVSQWSREIQAELVDVLNQNREDAPAVLVLDMLLVSPKDGEGDLALARACAEAGNVIVAVNAVHRQEVSLINGALTVDEDHVEMVEFPYQSLADVTEHGFANAYIDRDGYIRYARAELDYGGQKLESLSVAAYRAYTRTLGIPFEMPAAKDGFFAFSYTAKGGEGFEVLSLCDVLDGKIPSAAFRNCAVFVGAYAPGMQDAYSTPIDRGSPMYGVEIHANIFKALLEQQTAIPVDRAIYALAVGLLAALFYLLVDRCKILASTVAVIAVAAGCVLASRLFYAGGMEVGLVYPVLLILLLYAAKLVLGYALETVKKRKVLNAFKKYVAPQVVDELAKKGDFTIKLGGEKREIAVLFVDIRGFTPMSEGLLPEQVVEILNEYLSLTTDAIFKNKGTLDKFIGDATMAIFNAPFDLDDYVFRAVRTAMDIAKGSDALEKKLTERFGRSVSFGVGVHCGDAVVGNIGCTHRMDFTAIGDTVNTAARLESNAGRGEILISREVYLRVKDRVIAEELGAIPLKGKSREVFVYRLTGFKETEEKE